MLRPYSLLQEYLATIDDVDAQLMLIYVLEWNEYGVIKYYGLLLIVINNYKTSLTIFVKIHTFELILPYVTNCSKFIYMLRHLQILKVSLFLSLE